MLAGRASGAEACRVPPSRLLGQVPGTRKGSSVAAILLLLLMGWRAAGGVGSSSVGAREEGWVEGERCVVFAVAELVVWEREEGTE